jgi:hypothetical protein
MHAKDTLPQTRFALKQYISYADKQIDANLRHNQRLAKKRDECICKLQQIKGE